MNYKPHFSLNVFFFCRFKSFVDFIIQQPSLENNKNEKQHIAFEEVVNSDKHSVTVNI